MRQTLLLLSMGAFLSLCQSCISHKPVLMSKKQTIPDRTYHNPIIAMSLPDPTVIRAHDGNFYLYSTESVRNVPIYKSRDLVNWEFVGTAFTDKTRPHFVPKAGIWAPDINFIDGKYVLYYAMSQWGGEWTCGIGVATSDNPEGPFTDKGKLFVSSEIGVRNSIDEFYIEDQGVKYLFWGSFHGIYAIALSHNGLSLAPNAKPIKVAGNFMEAPYIVKRNGYYYLLGSNGTCCEGEKSTYRVTVGRSRNILGPYVNRKGETLLSGKYDVLLHRNKNFVGTGHNAEFITDDNGDDWIIYHAYLAQDVHAGRVACMDKVVWIDGWPTIRNNSPSDEEHVPYFK